MTSPFKSAATNGFTLIEIVLVLVLLTVLAAVSLPNFSGSFRNIILQTSANQIASLMRYAQGRAVTRRQTVQFVLARDMRTYRLRQRDEDENLDVNTDAAVYTDIPGRWGRSFQLPAEIELEATQQTFDFYPDGRIAAGRIFLCQKDKCCTLSTQDQRGRVLILNGRMP